MLSLHQRHVLTIVKKLVKQQYLLDVSSEYGKLRCTNRRLRGRLWSLGHRSKFQRLSRMAMLLQWRCSPEANQTLHDVWLSPGLVHCIYISGAFSLWLNLARLKIHFACLSCVLLFWQHYCTALELWASATHFWHGTRNGIMEVSHKAPPIFGYAAIMFGIGPHSDFIIFYGQATLWNRAG